MKTTVVNIRHEQFEVRIGRPSKWGNPFKIGVDGTREEVIAKYKEWLPTSGLDPKELKGKRLGCYCAPKPCHGDVLAEAADAIPELNLTHIRTRTKQESDYWVKQLRMEVELLRDEKLLLTATIDAISDQLGLPPTASRDDIQDAIGRLKK